MASFRPLYDRVLVKRVDPADRTAGGLFLPEAAKEKPQQALVVAVGPGKPSKKGDITPMTVQPGQTVLFGKYAGDELKVDGEDHIILREEDILAIID